MVIVLIFLGLVVAFITGVGIYTRVNPQFGGRITLQELTKLAQSKQWNGKVFVNTAPIDLAMGPLKIMKIMKQSLSNTTTTGRMST